MTKKRPEIVSPTSQKKPKPHNKYFLQYLIVQVNAIDFFVNYAPKFLSDVLDWNRLSIEPTVMYPELGSVCQLDAIITVPFKKQKNKYAVLIIEHKKGKDNKVSIQTTIYVVNSLADAWKKANCTPPDGKDPFQMHVPLVVIISHGAPDWTPCPLSTVFGEAVPELEGYVIDMNPIHINLSKLKDDEIVGSVATRVVIHTLIMASAKRLKKDFYLILRHFGEEEMKDNNAWLLFHTLMYAADTSQALNQEELDEALIQAFGKKGKKMGTSFIEKMWDEMVEREARGEARGEAVGKAKTIISFLKKKFGSVSKTMEKQILGMTDLIALDSLLENIWDSKSLKEVAALLKK